jgi:BirA family transcriptional regulator, biotin operon repressor / biotin---[acetyl-CoA-carboxylase] ligase
MNAIGEIGAVVTESPAAAAIAGHLRDDTRARLATLQVVDETASTQADLLATPAPQHGCAVLLARRQRDGQGRRGRAWISAEGNLALSLARRIARPLRELSGLSLAAGVATVEALHVLGVHEAGLKWPNDLVAGNRKLGGLLVDARADGGGSIAVIGVGMNVALPAPLGQAIEQPWCDLESLGHAIGRDALAAAVIDALAEMLERFECEGLAPFLPRWARHDAYAGRAARVLDGAREHVGTVLGIADDGALRLLGADGEQRFHAGELSLRAR